MIKINDLSYSYPNKDLFKQISFTLDNGVHCAFIGISGSGKSTLANLIIDPEQYLFEGTLEMEDNTRIAYVSQFYEVDSSENLTVFEYIAKDFIYLRNKLEAIGKEMERSEEIDLLLEKYQETSDKFDAIDGHNFESTVKKHLNLANLDKLKDLALSELSGGEFKLIQVIKEMIKTPDLMIMDEPDVFLDFENLNSLKNLINSYKGTLLVITHNRYLLNNCFNKIIHIENMDLQEFDGSYIDYNFYLLETKIELQELAHIDNEEIKRNNLLIDKFRFAAEMNSNASIGQHVNSRVKIQERLLARRIKAPFVSIKQANIDLSVENEIEDTTALKVENYSVAFDDLLLENVNFEIKSNDKVVLIGANGTGKTTLLRDIFKNKNDSISFDEQIKASYLSQIQNEMLNTSNTIFQEFFDAGFKTFDDIIAYLENYGFDEDILKQKIGSLSGGERNILQLAKIALAGSNMLLLDEPTSHLDTYSQIAFEESIQNYKGAILMISHDFYSIVNCMDYVLLIEDKSIRKMSIRKFRKMIYAEHFDIDYLENEADRRSIELKIALALESNNFDLAKVLSEKLETLIKSA